MKEFFSTPRYKRMLNWIGAIVALLVVFQVGMFVGFHKARMALAADARYDHMFGEHFNAGPLGIPSDDFPEAHGAMGKVLSVNLPTIVLEDKNTEKVVRITDDTTIRKDHDKITAASIQPNDFIVVIGSPNDKDEIEARFIRSIPPPPGLVATTSQAVSTSTIK